MVKCSESHHNQLKVKYTGNHHRGTSSCDNFTASPRLSERVRLSVCVRCVCVCLLCPRAEFFGEWCNSITVAPVLGHVVRL